MYLDFRSVAAPRTPSEAVRATRSIDIPPCISYIYLPQLGPAVSTTICQLHTPHEPNGCEHNPTRWWVERHFNAQLTIPHVLRIIYYLKLLTYVLRLRVHIEYTEMFVAVVLSLNFEPLPCVNFMLPLARYHAVTATNYITVPDLNAHNFRSCHTKPVSNTELADRMLRDYR